MMNLKYFLPLAFLLVLSVTACSGPSSGVSAEPTEPTGQVPTSSGAETRDQSSVQTGETVSDEQGQVVVTVTPLNLNNPNTTLNFEVVLDTHSVDLSMDLAPLAMLSSDNGLTVQAANWDAPRGGHHVSGILSFPAEVEGTALLAGTSRLTLTIRNVDVPERTFVWNIPK
jgi:hypothetical protein